MFVGTVRTDRAVLAVFDVVHACRWHLLGEKRLRFGLDCTQCDDVVEVAEKLGRLVLGAQTRRKVGDELGCHKDLEACAATFVEELNQGFVDDFRGFVDEDRNGDLLRLEVVAITGHTGEV